MLAGRAAAAASRTMRPRPPCRWRGATGCFASPCHALPSIAPFSSRPSAERHGMARRGTAWRGTAWYSAPRAPARRRRNRAGRVAAAPRGRPANTPRAPTRRCRGRHAHARRPDTAAQQPPHRALRGRVHLAVGAPRPCRRCACALSRARARARTYLNGHYTAQRRGTARRGAAQHGAERHGTAPPRAPARRRRTRAGHVAAASRGRLANTPRAPARPRSAPLARRCRGTPGCFASPPPPCLPSPRSLHDSRCHGCCTHIQTTRKKNDT